MARLRSGSGGSERGDDFAAQAVAPRPRLLVELWEFIATSKKWWLAPVVVILLLVGALIMLSSTAAGSLIYTFF